MRSRREAEAAAKVLEVDLDGLTSASLGQAYKALARLHHPDVGGGDLAKFQALQQAKGVLVSWVDGLSGSGLVGLAPTSSRSSSAGACTACGGSGIRKVTRGFSTMRLSCTHCESKER